ncbi:MAG: N-formylglutamate amidohydrolase [Paracoccaceae bacterium]
MAQDYTPVVTHGADRASRWVVTCDHATPIEPPGIDLGLPPAEMARHIAYDIGAEGVARALADALGAPMVASRFSRLVIDPNRGADDPTLVMRLYDRTIVPGNRAVDLNEIARRRALCWQPYDDALGRMVAGAGPDPIVVAVHSFTPRLRGRPPRPWHVGILHGGDRRLSDPLLASLHADPALCVGENEPYTGHLPGDAVDRHALRQGRLNALLEIRQDLIADDEGQRSWGIAMARHLTTALTTYEEHHHG